MGTKKRYMAFNNNSIQAHLNFKLKLFPTLQVLYIGTKCMAGNFLFCPLSPLFLINITNFTEYQ